jgi:hypothetical protein
MEDIIVSRSTLDNITTKGVPYTPSDFIGF